MIKRNGSTIRTLLVAVVLVALIYFVYLYNGVQSLLRHSEIVAEKFKRDRESLSSQLNDINIEKETIKEKHSRERQEMITRITDMQHKYKMLQSQHQDMESEFTRLQQRFDKFTEDTKQKEINRNQEFMQLKQEKEMEIVKLRDQNANIIRENEQLKAELVNLKQQFQQQQQEAFQAWNYASQLKKTVDHLQLSLEREARTSEMLRKQLDLTKAMNMKNMVMKNADAGGVIGKPHLGTLDNPQGDGGILAGILHRRGRPHMNAGENIPEFNLGGAQNKVVQKPEVQEQFQIQPAHLENVNDGGAGAGAGVALDDLKPEGKDLLLQRQEAEQRKQEGDNERNQVQAPLNNNGNNDGDIGLHQLDEDEAERDNLFGMLNRRRLGKDVDMHEPDRQIAQPVFQSNENSNKNIEPPLQRINVEDKLAGRDSQVDHQNIVKDKILEEALIGQNLDVKDVFETVKRSRKGNRHQKLDKLHGLENGLQADEKEVQVQHPKNADGGDKKGRGQNNEDQYYDEEEEDNYQ